MAAGIAFLEGALPDGDATPAPEAEASSEEAPTETQEDSPKAEPPKVEPTKVETKPEEEKPSPQVERLTNLERSVREERTALKAERATFAEEKSKWQAERGATEDLERLAKTDLVGLAERVKMDPQARMKLAIELWESAQNPEKQTPQYREQAQQRTKLTATEERIAKLEAEAREAKERAHAMERQAQVSQIQSTMMNDVETVLKAASGKAVYTQAFLQTHRAEVQTDLWTLATQLWEADPETEITAADLVNRYEAILAKRYEPLKTVFGAVQTKTTTNNGAEMKPSTTLSAQRTNSPTKARPEPQTEEELLEEGAAFLRSLQG
jgi:hypothetical protein